MWWIVAALVVGAGAFLAVGLWVATIVLLVVIVVALPFRRVDVTVDGKELTVRYAGPVAPTHRIRRRDIETVTVVDDIRPGYWGGWGYRWRWGPSRAAVLIRRGPGIQIVTRGGKVLAITVDDPEGAVAALQD